MSARGQSRHGPSPPKTVVLRFRPTGQLAQMDPKPNACFLIVLLRIDERLLRWRAL
jgi:hypothetical protein